MPDHEALEDAQTLFSALADRARLRILFAFQSGDELCVCDVAHVLGVSVSTASHHLRRLRDLKLLKYRNDGKMAYYSLRDKFAGRMAVQALNHAEQKP
jgi:DNA-binding transcriptional ArsR family regulator